MKLSFKVAEELNTKQFIDMSNYQEVKKNEPVQKTKRDAIVVHILMTGDEEYEIDEAQHLRDQEYQQSQLMSQGHDAEGEDHISRQKIAEETVAMA